VRTVEDRTDGGKDLSSPSSLSSPSVSDKERK
jgi:hypothetical protein